MSEISSKLDDDETSVFVGRKHAWYQYKWNVAARRTGRYSWNWAACLFGPAWMAYRKMYEPAAITCLATWVLCVFGLLVVHTSVTVQNALIALPGVAVCIAAGLFGNELYRRYVKRQILRLKQHATSDAVSEAELRARGGTSWIGALLLWMVTAVCAYMPGIAHLWAAWH
jgi:hypothetical protein